MAKIKVDGGSIPPAVPKPRAGHIPQPKRWAFSLQHWRQIEYFGVDTCEKKWFISLIERFSELSRLPIEEFLASRSLQGSVRYHEIDWDAKAIPIKKSDIDWIGPITESEDFSFVQFHVSKALGRVVGFFDENQIFQVVLLDPKHNIQPSGNFDYRVRTTYAGECQLTTVVSRLELSITSNRTLSEKEKEEFLAGMHVDYKDATDGCVILAIPQEDIDKAHRLMAAGLAGRFGEFLSVALAEMEKD